MIKKIIGYIGSYLTYGIGHLVSIPMAKWDVTGLYYIYTKFMTWSFQIHDWAEMGNTLWTKIENEDESDKE